MEFKMVENDKIPYRLKAQVMTLENWVIESGIGEIIIETNLLGGGEVMTCC